MALIQVMLSLGVGAWLALELARALRTGEARGRFLSFTRQKDALPFWLLLILQAALALICFWVALRAVR